MAVYKSKNPTKDGRSYYFRIKYKDIFGEVHDYSSQKFKNKKDADAEEARYKLKVINKETVISSITISQAYLEFLSLKKQEVKKQTIEKIENLYKYLKPIEKSKIDSIDILLYKKFRYHIESKNFSTDYSNRIQNLFVEIIKYSHKYYNTSDAIIKFIIPFKDVNKFKKEFDIFTIDEYKLFDSKIERFDYHCFFEILFFVGLRCGECMALTYKDIDFGKKTININKTLTTKLKSEKWTISTPKTKNSIRLLPVSQKIIDDLKEMQKKAKGYTDYNDNWFIFGNTRPFAESSIASVKSKCCEEANLKCIRVHDFRHSFASMLISLGASITLVSKYMGHSSVSITLDVYGHLLKNELDNIILKINELN